MKMLLKMVVTFGAIAYARFHFLFSKLVSMRQTSEVLGPTAVPDSKLRLALECLISMQMLVHSSDER